MRKLPSSLFAFVALTLAACGPGVDDFLGTWTYSGGNVNLDCEEDQIDVTPEGELSFAEGVESDLVLISPGGCSIDFNLEDNLATVVPGQECMYLGIYADRTYTATQTIERWTFTLSDDGATLTASADSSAVLDYGEGEMWSCRLTETSTLTRAVE